jgi:hypothetical protein
MPAPGTEQTGYNARTPTDTLIGPAVLRATIGGVADTVVGVSKNGLAFHPGIELKENDYDGRRAPIVGGDRITFRRPTFARTMLQLGPEDHRLFEPGGTGTGSTPGTVVPKKAGIQFVIGEYIPAMSLTFPRAGGGTVKYLFAYAICKQYDVNSQPDDQGEIPVVFEARLDRADVSNDDGTVPYTITVTDPA